MAKIVNHKEPEQKRPLIMLQPQTRRPKFRWALILVPLACLFALWFLNHIEPTITWDDVLDLLHVVERHKYSKAAVLGLTLIGIVAVLRVTNGTRHK